MIPAVHNIEQVLDMFDGRFERKSPSYIHNKEVEFTGVRGEFQKYLEEAENNIPVADKKTV